MMLGSGHPKTNAALFCTGMHAPSASSLQHKHEHGHVMQIQLYEAVVESKAVHALLTTPTAPSTSVLPIITKLRKLCNSPALLYDAAQEDEGLGLSDLYPHEFDASSRDTSGNSIQALACKIMQYSISSSVYLV